MDENEIQRILTDCLFGYSVARSAEITDQMRFAHYTSAKTAMDIIQAKPEDRSLWLRNATEMNDFSEIEFGQHCFQQALAIDHIKQAFLDGVNGIDGNMVADVVGAMDDESHRIKATTFLLSLALHDPMEQQQGLLSMWRAYGGDANVCLILKTAPFTTKQNAYDVNLSPVMYDGLMGFGVELLKISKKLIEHRDVIRKIPRDIVASNLKRAIDFAILSTKHPSFREENEWRIIYRPPELPVASDVPSKIVCLDGIVQKVYYLPLVNKPDLGVVAVGLEDILEKIIIGPTPNPHIVREAFIELLKSAGVADAGDKVTVSGVPLKR